MALTIRTFTGKATEAFQDDLARLRIQVFYDFPYLYEGSLEYEQAYLKAFFEAQNAVLVIAQDGDKVIGASTALPILEETQNIQRPFIEQKMDLSKIFYFSESILDNEYRGKGIGVAFFEQREAWAKQLGFETAVFCGVIRPENHPLRPIGYEPLDKFWQKRGFQKIENVTCEMSWKDRNETNETVKNLAFWQKQL